VKLVLSFFSSWFSRLRIDLGRLGRNEARPSSLAKSPPVLAVPIRQAGRGTSGGKPCALARAKPNMTRRVSAIKMARREYQGWPCRVTAASEPFQYAVWECHDEMAALAFAL
jgi:hypothetical protein